MNTYMGSISSRGLLYVPKEVQERMNINKPSKIYFRFDKGRVYIEKAVDFFNLAGSLKKKRAPKDFDFRKYMEENYERV